MIENETFTIIDDNNVEHQAVIVYRVVAEDEGNTFGKTFIFFYIENDSDDEEVLVEVASIDEESGELIGIETVEEQEYIEDIFNNLEESIEE